MDSAPRGECHRPISGLLEVVKCRTDTIFGAPDPENLDILLFLLIFLIRMIIFRCSEGVNTIFERFLGYKF